MIRFAVPVLFACALGATMHATRAQPGTVLLRLWVDAALRHTPGEADASAREIADWSKDQLLSIVQDVTSSSSPDDAIRHGAVLHLDIALRVPARATGPLFRSYPRTGPPPPPIPFYVVDGTGSGLGVSATHLELAREIIRKLQPPAARREFARVWYVASAAELARRKNFAELQVHLERARDLLPGDPDVLLATGCLHEFFAGPTAQSVARDRSTIRVGDRGANLRRAERNFREALSADRGLIEARIRLGRVLGLQGRHAEAAKELEIATAAADDTVLAYYAALFLGRAEESRGRLEPARRHFERAAQLFPAAQSPRIALSRLAAAAGDEPGAQRALEEALVGKFDPWWTYELGPGRYADRKMTELYEVLGEHQR